MIDYKISPAAIKTFGSPHVPFLAFDQFVDIVRWWRDYYYARDNVKDYDRFAGKEDEGGFAVWTKSTISEYKSHLFIERLKGDLTLRFKVVDISKSAHFTISVELFDGSHDYFAHLQQLCVERYVGGRWLLSSWKRVPSLSEFLLKEYSDGLVNTIETPSAA